MKQITVNKYPLHFLDYAKALAKANKTRACLSTYEVLEDVVVITTIREN